MKPQTVLSKVPRDKLDATMQAAFDRSLAMHDDATFVEAMGHAPHVYHWYQNDFYKMLFSSNNVPASVSVSLILLDFNDSVIIDAPLFFDFICFNIS